MHHLEDSFKKSTLPQRFKVPTIFIIIVCVVTLFVFLAASNLDRKFLQPLLEKNKQLYKQRDYYYICPTWAGRLGNMMFQYASLYGIARRNGMTLAISTEDIPYKTFNLSVNALEKKERTRICNRAVVVEYPVPAKFFNISIPSNMDVRFIGQFQSWKYFSHYEEDLRSQFTFKEEVKTAAKLAREEVLRTIASIKSSKLIIIGVHIRRGDYVNDIQKTASSEYLEKARNYYRRRYKNVVFLVFTNKDEVSRSWCSDNFVNGNDDTILMSAQSAEVDMVFLSQCDHLILTVGAFGWWAGWLNNGTIVTYKDFVTPDVKTYNRYSKEDYIYPTWIAL